MDRTLIKFQELDMHMAWQLHEDEQGTPSATPGRELPNSNVSNRPGADAHQRLHGLNTSAEQVQAHLSAGTYRLGDGTLCRVIGSLFEARHAHLAPTAL